GTRSGKYPFRAGHHFLQTPVSLGNPGPATVVPRPGLDTQTRITVDTDIWLGARKHASHRYRPLIGHEGPQADCPSGNRKTPSGFVGSHLPGRYPNPAGRATEIPGRWRP